MKPGRARRQRGQVALVLALALAAGCGSPTTKDAPQLREIEVATRAVDRALGLSTALVIAGNVDVGATPDIIAAALVNRLQSEAAGCVNAVNTMNTVHADFGASCALATAMMHAGGTVDLTVTQQMMTSEVDIAAQLALTVDDGTLAGSFVITTTDGDNFTYSGMLTLDGVTVNVPLVNAGIGAGGATMDAMKLTADGTAFTLTAVHERFSGCYPDDGVATLGSFAVTFANGTPQDGQVMLDDGSGAALPTRTGCPPKS
jgi:hypothetical protein